MQAPRLSTPSKPGLWQRTPPAIFPPILGAFGLALGWQRATDAFGISPATGELLLGAVTLLYLFALLAYLAKVVRRPGVVVDDLKVLPGRAGLGTMGMGGMLLALALLDYLPVLVPVVLVVAVAAHALIGAIIARQILTGPAEARLVSPVFHITYVGFIVSPFAALALGWTTFSEVVFWGAMGAAVLIWGASIAQFVKSDVPAPLRPLLAIHLAPASLLGIVAMMLGKPVLGLVFGVLAIAIFALLVVRGRWLLAAGFSPFWGGMTFPLAAFASLMMILGASGQGELFRITGGLALVAASLFIPYVLVKVVQLWSKGQLAVKTNAAAV